MGFIRYAGGKPDMTAPVAGILASDLAVGSVVKLMEDGVATEYLVVNQGIPRGSILYDESCNGTWLLRKDIIEGPAWEADNVNKLESSDIHSWLNSYMLAKYDTNAQKAIKPVLIPYRKNGGYGGSNQSGENGLSCKVFLLDGYEVGYPIGVSNKLGYFEEGATTTANAKRIAYLNGKALTWWLRSPKTDSVTFVWYISQNGSAGNTNPTSAYGIRPALVLPSTAVFDENTMLLKGVS